MKRLVVIPLFLCMVTGMMIGFVLCPIWFGITVANEMMEKYFDELFDRQEALKGKTK